VRSLCSLRQALGIAASLGPLGLWGEALRNEALLRADPLEGPVKAAGSCVSQNSSSPPMFPVGSLDPNVWTWPFFLPAIPVPPPASDGRVCSYLGGAGMFLQLSEERVLND